MTVILLVATYNGNHNWELFSESLYKLNPAPDKVIFCENNSTDGTLNNLVNFKLPHEIIRVWFKEDMQSQIQVERWDYLTIAHPRQLLLTRAKQLNPDYAILTLPLLIPLSTSFTSSSRNTFSRSLLSLRIISRPLKSHSSLYPFFSSQKL